MFSCHLLSATCSMVLQPPLFFCSWNVTTRGGCGWIHDCSRENWADEDLSEPRRLHFGFSCWGSVYCCRSCSGKSDLDAPENPSECSRTERSRIRLSGNHYGRAGAVQFRQITGGGHVDLQAWALPANDRTIRVGLRQRALQASASSTSSLAGVPELARLADLWKCPGLLEGW